MAHVQFMDSIVSEYLLYRGFSSTLKAFDNELKNEKDKGFRVDKIVENLLLCIQNYDLMGLKDTWCHLETKIFSKLDHHVPAAARKLENALLKYYVVHAIENGKSDKVNEFFSKLTGDLSGQPDWKDWFAIPYVKYPEENTTFAVFFTRQWQDCLCVSLHNFLASVYQNLPLPTLAAFEETNSKIVTLQKENDILRRGLAKWVADNESEQNFGQPSDDLSDIMDDFHNISLEVKTAEQQAKTLKALRKGVSVSVSPKSFTMPQSQSAPKKPFIKTITSTKRSSSTEPKPNVRRERDSSLDASRSKPLLTQPDKQEGSCLLLGQEEYNEHTYEIIALKLNRLGDIVASLDISGVLRMWNVSTCETIIEHPAWPEAGLIEWTKHSENVLLCADATGPIRLLNTSSIVPLSEISFPSLATGYKITDIISNPSEASALIIVDGKVHWIDLKILRRVVRTLPVNGEVSSCCFNSSGNLIICGCVSGNIILIDAHKNEVTETIPFISLSVSYVCVSTDRSICFFLANDNQLRWTSLLSKDRLIHSAQFVVPNSKKLFCLDRQGTLILTCDNNYGVIYKISGNEIRKCLELGGHKSAVTRFDWSFANQCASCVTASSDGKIRVSTLLTDTVKM